MSSGERTGLTVEWAQQLLYFPSERRFDYDHPLAALRLQRHRDALMAGAASYVDPETGDTVLTAESLMEQGFCCSLGCRHCPFTGGRRQVIPGIVPG